MARSVLGIRQVLPLLAGAVMFWPSTAEALGDRDAAALQEMSDLANGRNGTLCWQSRRTGPMRIFASDFDGSNLRQLTPDVAANDHLGCLISPDGSKVLYYETRTLSDSNYYNDHTGDMMMVDASDTEGSTAQLLVPDVRTYFECRFARWIDNDQIAYIADDHHTYIYSISQGSSTKQFDYTYSEFGAIPNRQMTHAIDGRNRLFSINGSSLTEEQDFNGCEGNMSWDGRFAYRVEGDDHHFVRMNLQNMAEQTFFNNGDSALPSSQNYIYFPQISTCQRFLALGASPMEHPHFTSDYDIFIVPIDTDSFQGQGDAVKYSFDDSLDAYPDLWVEQPGSTGGSGGASTGGSGGASTGGSGGTSGSGGATTGGSGGGTGGGATGGSSSGTGGTAVGAFPQDEEASGCACTAPKQSRGASYGALALLVVGALAMRKRF